jgi:hypothetical protein
MGPRMYVIAHGIRIDANLVLRARRQEPNALLAVMVYFLTREELSETNVPFFRIDEVGD